MGCGISRLDAENSALNPRSNRAPVVIDKKDFENGDEGHVGLMHGNNKNNNNKHFVMEMKPLSYEETKYIYEGPIGERLKEKSVVESEIGGKEKHSGVDDKRCAKNVEEEHENRDYIYICPGSPSFRVYCNDYDCGDRTSIGDSNDCDSMNHSIKNGSDDDSSNENNKSNIEGVNSNKEREKKERRRRGFRNAINKGKTRGRKNLLNFVCYNASHESYADNSFNKIATKTA